MLLFAEATINTIASYATSVPEPFELLIFGVVIATGAFLLRNAPKRALRAKANKEAAEKA